LSRANKLMLQPLTPNEESQTLQTIEMFEVIVKSDPSDGEALEILREAYFKLGREKDVIRTSRRIAQAYVQHGEISSAILEFESILRRYPDDPDALALLQQIQSKAGQLADPEKNQSANGDRPAISASSPIWDTPASKPEELNDGKSEMRKLFVEGKHISAVDFDLYWITPDRQEQNIVEPFIQRIAEKQLLALDMSMKLLCERARTAYLPLDKYDIDIELARTYPREVCSRWCILPLDRMSKSLLVATANPFNEQAVRELDRFHVQTANRLRILWYVVSPVELVKALRKTFR
jgi:hypothetical protein